MLQDYAVALCSPLRYPLQLPPEAVEPPWLSMVGLFVVGVQATLPGCFVQLDRSHRHSIFC